MSLEISNCGDQWDDVESNNRDEVFSRNIIFENDYLASKGELVGQSKLIYRINGLYYKEIEAWKVMVGITLCGTDQLGQTPERVTQKKGGAQRSPDVEKIISSFRPSGETLKSFNLKEGENSLTYTYYVAQGVLDQVSVKIYLYKSSDKVIISDIDGTITKYLSLNQV